MPYKPKRACSQLGCPNLVTGKGSYCLIHAKQEEKRYEAARPSSSQRGYDAKWRKYQAAFLRNHPYCVNNLKDPNCQMIASCVDHKISVKGPNDPMFWEPSNHQPMCQRCHSSKTAREDRRWGTKRKSD